MCDNLEIQHIKFADRNSKCPNILDRRCIGIPSYFPAIFTKGNNFCDFLFAFLDDEALQKWGLLLKERICH